MPPDEPTEEERLQELAEDNGTPFQPASDDAGIPSDHPATDTNIDSTELYNEGVSGVAEVEDRTHETGIADYDPEEEE